MAQNINKAMKSPRDSTLEKEREPTKMKHCGNILRMEMNLSKLTYFLCEGYMGSVLPYLNIFFVTLGLTTAQAGLITGISFAVAAVAGPLWASLIDSTGHRKLFFVILCAGNILSVFTMPWVSQAVATYHFQRTCFNVSNNTQPPFPHPPMPQPPFPHPVIVNGTACFMRRILNNSSTLFYTLLVLNIVSKVFFVTLPHYIDGLVMTVVKTRRQPTTFGEQRVFGVVGFGLGNFLTGLAVDHYKGAGLSPYVVTFYVFLPYAVLLIPAGVFLIKQIPRDTGSTIENDVGTFLRHLKTFFKNGETMMHMCTVVVSGTALNVFFNFLVLFMIQDLHAPKMTITLTFLVCMLTQLIGYPLSSRVINFFGGPIPAITLGVFSYLPRYLLMSYLKQAWWTLPVQLFEPFGLAFSWAAMMEYTYELAPREITMSAINMVGVTHFVGTGALANIVGGVAFHAYGGRVVFRGMGVLCGVWSVVMLCYHRNKFHCCYWRSGHVTGMEGHVSEMPEVRKSEKNMNGAYCNSVDP